MCIQALLFLFVICVIWPYNIPYSIFFSPSLPFPLIYYNKPTTARWQYCTQNHRRTSEYKRTATFNLLFWRPNSLKFRWCVTLFRYLAVGRTIGKNIWNDIMVSESNCWSTSMVNKIEHAKIKEGLMSLR